MDAIAHLLLLAVVSASPSLGGDPYAPSSPWTADSVARSAAANAPVAAALQSERRAVGCGLDRDDKAACAQVGLIQAVLADLAAHDQNRAAGDALASYYQIIAIEQQQTLLGDADQILGRLIESAQRAEQLELGDGDSLALRQRRLTLADQAVQAQLGAVQLRIRLGELIGQPPQAAVDMALSSEDLSGAASHAADGAADRSAANGTLSSPSAPADDGDARSRGYDVSGPAAESAVALAFARRADLRAIRTLCRCMSADALPGARRLLGLVQPGLGLTLAAGRSPLLALHGAGESTNDLACRRSQCQQLLEMRQRQIQAEVLREVVAVQLASQRLALQRQNTELAEQVAEETRAAVQLDQAAIGADLLAELEALEARGELLQRQADAAVAGVRLRQAQGIAAEPAL